MGGLELEFELFEGFTVVMSSEVGGFGVADLAFAESGGDRELFEEFVPALGDELLGLRAFEFFGDPLHGAEFGEGLP